MSSAYTIETIVPDAAFYQVHNDGVGALFASTLSCDGSEESVASAWKDICTVEACVEALRELSERRTNNSDVKADLAMYVPPLSSPSKDTLDSDVANVKDLETAVNAWIQADKANSRCVSTRFTQCSESLTPTPSRTFSVGASGCSVLFW